MIAAVRRFLVVLMILLLPLRGLIGDAMATQMLAPVVLAQAAVFAGSGAHHHAIETALHAHPDGTKSATTGAAHDCFDHASAGQTSSPGVPECQSCPTCQACNIVALFTPVSMASLVLPVPLQKQQPAVSRFTSADRALSVKPPIS